VFKLGYPRIVLVLGLEGQDSAVKFTGSISAFFTLMSAAKSKTNDPRVQTWCREWPWELGYPTSVMVGVRVNSSTAWVHTI